MGRWWLGAVALVGVGALAVGAWHLRHDVPLGRGEHLRPAPDRGPPDVVLIVVDTLRADHLGVYGHDADTSPRIDAFARESLRFTFAIAPAPWTAPSVASVFTGLYPTAHGVSRHADAKRVASGRIEAAALADGFQTLAEALRGAGYTTACITANPWVDDALGFAQGFDRFETASGALAEEINERALRFLDGLPRERAPFFLYLHYMDPHTPYSAPSGRAVPAGPRTRERYGTAEVSLLERYDAEIAYVDAQVGELLDALRARSLYDDAVVVLTSDHGEQFRERGRLGHGHHVFNPEVHVPLLLKVGDRRGEVEAAVSLVDLYPTLLELAGVAPGASPQGVSLLDADALAGRGVFSEVTRQRNHKAFTRSDGVKLILSYDARRGAFVTRESGVVGLFDTRRDAREERPLDDDALLAEMKDGFYALYADSVVRGRGRPEASAVLPEQTARELRALGYLDASEGETADAPAP